MLLDSMGLAMDCTWDQHCHICCLQHFCPQGAKRELCEERALWPNTVGKRWSINQAFTVGLFRAFNAVLLCGETEEREDVVSLFGGGLSRNTLWHTGWGAVFLFLLGVY